MGVPIQKQVYYSVIINGKIYNVTGRKRTNKGYVVLCIKDHPNSDVLGYIMEHRIVMEIILNRFLDANEVVHHKNGVKHDNRIGNLELMDFGYHTTKHNTGRKHSSVTKNKISKKATERLRDITNHPSYKVIDKEIFEDILLKHGPKKTAEKLSISRKTVYNKIKEFGLEERYKNAK